MYSPACLFVYLYVYIFSATYTKHNPKSGTREPELFWAGSLLKRSTKKALCPKRVPGRVQGLGFLSQIMLLMLVPNVGTH